jgi:hypothetical protein
MPYKSEIERMSKHKAYLKARYAHDAEFRARHKARIEARKSEIKKWYKEYKLTQRCTRCAEDHPACLEFHHLDPKQKDLHLAQAVDRGWSVERLKAELAKCACLCSNCHRKFHRHEEDAD